MSRKARIAIVGGIILAVGLVVALALSVGDASVRRRSLADLLHDIAAGKVASVVIVDDVNRAEARLTNGERLTTTYPAGFADELTKRLDEAPNDPGFTVKDVGPGVAGQVGQLLPYVILVGAFLFIVFTLGPRGRGMLGMGRSRGRVAVKDRPDVTFADVAGLDEAVEELCEIVEFLKEPERFRKLGARIPKGVLLFGPPGTGKTLLARAVAGEAGVPFYSLSGSDFVEMFVGVGAARVRDLFREAKANGPAIVFIDEIDAVGRHRGAGLGGGHDEREQTLNQLLVEMDGFVQGADVILVAATNRPDILDPALLRPGRFDRRVAVDHPDLAGRVRILRVHMRGRPISSKVDVDAVAKRTVGFSGADLANVVNEATLLAARRDERKVGPDEMNEAVERVVAGPERRSRVLSEPERHVTAVHESGHAVVAHALPHATEVHKVSIVSRGQALGYTLALPERDRVLLRRSELRDQLVMLLGGRSAEVVVCGEVSNGAADDIKRATTLARQMVCEFGMSDALAPRRFSGEEGGEVFLGRDLPAQRASSDGLAALVDAEIDALLAEAESAARSIVEANRETLEGMAQRLLEVESLEGGALAEILADVPVWEGQGLAEGGARSTRAVGRAAAPRSGGPAAGRRTS